MLTHLDARLSRQRAGRVLPYKTIYPRDDPFQIARRNSGEREGAPRDRRGRRRVATASFDAGPRGGLIVMPYHQEACSLVSLARRLTGLWTGREDDPTTAFSIFPVC